LGNLKIRNFIKIAKHHMEKQKIVQKTQLGKDEFFAPQLHVLSQSGNISNFFTMSLHILYFDKILTIKKIPR